MANILIIEDDPQIRDVLRITLKQAGHTVREAGDGAEGLAKARSGQDDLIILDIGLPAMDGIELCRRLRAEKNPCAVPHSPRRRDRQDHRPRDRR